MDMSNSFNLHINNKTKNIIYHKTKEFIKSKYAKGNVGQNGKILKQNNTGLFFEMKMASLLYNKIPVKKYYKFNKSIYIPDIETRKAIISCKIQETEGTAWQKIIMECIDLAYISNQTNKKVILLWSNYSVEKYFYKLIPYITQLNLSNKNKIDIITENYFKENIKTYD